MNIEKPESKNCENCGVSFSKDPRNTYKYWANAKFCSRACSGVGVAKIVQLKMGPAIDRIEKRSTKSEVGCWIWNGANNGKYGVIKVSGESNFAHRLALESRLGRKIHEGMFACHKCNNTFCVNPDHLYEGTPLQNSMDACLIGSHAKKLTARDAKEIKQSKRKNADLAREYGVSRVMIGAIKNGKKWRYV